jgi:hypothetical protein
MMKCMSPHPGSAVRTKTTRETAFTDLARRGLARRSLVRKGLALKGTTVEGEAAPMAKPTLWRTGYGMDVFFSRSTVVRGPESRRTFSGATPPISIPH